MMPTQRRQAILAEVRKTSAASAEQLAETFGVSVETIRRDLRGLRDQGLLERVYGGALSVRSTEGTFAARSTKKSATSTPASCSRFTMARFGLRQAELSCEP